MRLVTSPHGLHNDNKGCGSGKRSCLSSGPLRYGIMGAVPIRQEVEIAGSIPAYPAKFERR